MPTQITSGAELRDLVQETYFDGIDSGDPASAVDALAEDVQWTHRQVWEHDGHGRDSVDHRNGRQSVYEFLAARVDEMQAIGIEHQVSDAIYEDGRGAFRADVVGPEGRREPFLGWVDVSGGKITHYRVTPF